MKMRFFVAIFFLQFFTNFSLQADKGHQLERHLPSKKVAKNNKFLHLPVS